ncbi:hypothetical protein HH214_08125 [Mucilaginibacter robiniae]|uniref:Tetratricopeptide repeat protein n=1 Tax=Mucilaginibacter robiniae TaxID=2728022 RepID=A0A7L5DYI9_9SPHI|nr:hypothetical protein [Mucilaginibacter robiniae]QJD95841.1 hypothetical protein HH214_08125 [Mucilaginibacter robiniae]
MKALLLLVLCGVSFSASAQWWHFGKAKHVPLNLEAKSLAFQWKGLPPAKPQLTRVEMGASEYGLDLYRITVMKTAQHQMRFREYEDASYSFTELAKVYIKQNKMTEAKWFFLQSNNLSRQQNNDRLTIANLVDLAWVKTNIGDYALAQQDLEEARDLANAHGWADDVTLTQKKLSDLQHTKLAALTPAATYTSAVAGTF